MTHTIAITMTAATAITIPAIAPPLSPPASGPEVGPGGVPEEATQHKIISWGNTVEPLNSERIGRAISFTWRLSLLRGTYLLKRMQWCIGII